MQLSQPENNWETNENLIRMHLQGKDFLYYHVIYYKIIDFCNNYFKNKSKVISNLVDSEKTFTLIV